MSRAGLLVLLLPALACSSPVADVDGDSGVGSDGAAGASAGDAGSGGKVGSGGAAGSGGAVGSGGVLGSGGVVGSGGAVGSGGVIGSGGKVGSGGAVGSGGKVGSGGAVGSGGKVGSGGAVGSGGSVGSGGKVGSGGAAGSGTVGLGAPETSPVGYGKATTGGGNATPVAVATLAAAQAAVDGYSGTGGLVLRYTGKFNFSTISDPCVQHTLSSQKLEIKNKNNITLIGADGSAANFGIHIAASSSSIIVRNMTIGLLPGGSDSDMISIEGMSGGIPTNIWIDHNELFSSMADCPGAGDTAFDGMIDVKKGADGVTISYNYMHDHHKVSLNGFSDTDSEPRHVTFHHNLFENVGSRTPLQRFGYSHMLNNYFLKVLVSGINVRMGGYSLIEGNYFENVLNPVTSRDSKTIGYWELRNNNLVGKPDVSVGNKFGITWDAGNSGTVNATEWTTSAPFPVALGYSYTAQPFQCVHDGLRAAVGAGKGLATLKCN